MKGLFPEYTGGQPESYAEVWKQALFVFDTNVLLNLYRYQSATRDQLLKVLDHLSRQVWVPHHVALEFYRNRLIVIADQSKRFSDVRKVVTSYTGNLITDLEKLQLHQRHSLINPDHLVAGVGKLTESFLKELERLEESQQKLTGPDPLLQKIEEIFDGKVGSPPQDQTTVNEIYKEADRMFALQIPPGYLDAVKEKDEIDSYASGGIVYKRKFGDVLVWKQILKHLKESKIKSMVFVTDDNKEDWWQKVNSNGPKTIGPRPELVDEARREGGIETFLMYNPESFLKFSKEFLQAQISDETLREVRDVSASRASADRPYDDFRKMIVRAENAVYDWLIKRFEKVEKKESRYLDFVGFSSGLAVGFEIQFVRNPRIAMHRIRESVYRAYYALKEKIIDQLAIVWIVEHPEQVEDVKKTFVRFIRDELPEELIMMIGVVEETGETGSEFVLYEEFSCVEIKNALQGTLRFAPDV